MITELRRWWAKDRSERNRLAGGSGASRHGDGCPLVPIRAGGRPFGGERQPSPAARTAGIDAQALLIRARIDAEQREAADKLQKLILGKLHHRVKNTLAMVSAIASQSFRAAPSIEHGQKAMEGKLIALGRAHDLLMQVSWANASLTHTLSSATEPYDSQGDRRFHFNGPDIRISSVAVIALAMTFNELSTLPNLEPCPSPQAA
jgi:hypothetical protein